MKKLILGSISALALLTAAACSDSGTDATTTQSVPADQQQMDTAPAAPEAAPTAPADNGADSGAMEPTEPAPAQ